MVLFLLFALEAVARFPLASSVFCRKQKRTGVLLSAIQLLIKPIQPAAPTDAPTWQPLLACIIIIALLLVMKQLLVAPNCDQHCSFHLWAEFYLLIELLHADCQSPAVKDHDVSGSSAGFALA